MILSRIALTIVLALPAFSLLDVVVAKPPKAPALVVLAPAETFVKTFNIGPTSAPNIHSLMTVPLKKRLVIETITVLYRGGIQSNHVVHGAMLHALNGPNQMTYLIPVNRSDFSPNAVPNLPGSVMIAQSLANVRWYADGGQPLTFEMLTSATFSLTAAITISGYLLDLP